MYKHKQIHCKLYENDENNKKNIIKFYYIVLNLNRLQKRNNKW